MKCTGTSCKRVTNRVDRFSRTLKFPLTAANERRRNRSLDPRASADLGVNRTVKKRPGVVVDKSARS